MKPEPGLSENVADFVGIFTEKDLFELNSWLRISGEVYDWLLILEPNLGGGATIAGKGRYEEMIYAARAEHETQLPSLDNLPPEIQPLLGANTGIQSTSGLEG